LYVSFSSSSFFFFSQFCDVATVTIIHKRYWQTSSHFFHQNIICMSWGIVLFVKWRNGPTNLESSGFQCRSKPARKMLTWCKAAFHGLLNGIKVRQIVQMWTTAHQCTIHWKPCVTQLSFIHNMNHNWVTKAFITESY
jgi:hypothetical protein